MSDSIKITTDDQGNLIRTQVQIMAPAAALPGLDASSLIPIGVVGSPNKDGSSTIVFGHTVVPLQPFPCPFCGCPDAIVDLYETVNSEHDNKDLAAVFCQACEAAGPICKTSDEAIKSWNKALRDDTEETS